MAQLSGAGTSMPTSQPAAGKVASEPSSIWPRYEVDEIQAVVQVLQSGRVNSLLHGEQTQQFQREFAKFVQMPHAIAVANGTVSLEIALRSLGVGADDEVIVPARSFIATASAVVAIGAQPVFADIDIKTQNIDPVSVERMVSERTRAVICVHLAGHPCDMKALTDLCETHGLFLIEDCAQAHGALYDGQPVGSFGDASSFSFCTDKIMSTGGEGGMVLFRDEAAWAKAWAMKDHGKIPPELAPRNIARPGEFRYLHHSFGSNFRMTEMQAAIGRVQLRKLPAWLAQRRANAHALSRACAKLPGIIFDAPDSHVQPAWYKFYLRIDTRDLPAGMTRSQILARLMEQGIRCGSGCCPDMSRELAFRENPPRRDGELAKAHWLGERTIMFAVDHLLGEDDMGEIAHALEMVVT